MPNPALHLTPPADLERIAHPVMAVQVSYLFGQQRNASGYTEAEVRCSLADTRTA